MDGFSDSVRAFSAERTCLLVVGCTVVFNCLNALYFSYFICLIIYQKGSVPMGLLSIVVRFIEYILSLVKIYINE